VVVDAVGGLHLSHLIPYPTLQTLEMDILHTPRTAAHVK
jgi:hypothetical protein